MKFDGVDLVCRAFEALVVRCKFESSCAISVGVCTSSDRPPTVSFFFLALLLEPSKSRE